ncbi:MAG TPA: peroxidase family protein [Chthoniobacterales bacterium]|nr:peroxidase family protein [Chthoniobacterales bacterium]
MRYDIEREGTLTPRVGYTYFGQFVGHDLTHDTTPIDGPYLDPQLTPNYRTPYLDLDHIYGGGPVNSPNLYEGEAGAEVFKVGATTPTGYLRDLPIENGTILIGDERDLVNLILRQLHVVFLKFHNEAVKQLSAKPPAIIGIDHLDAGTIFEQAQRLVRWHYQWIVRHDFLPRILHPSAWNYRWGIARQPSKPKNGFAVPIEFSLAAFRFGHSMVRNVYGLNRRQKRVELAELMALGQTASPLQDDFIIEWGRFFDGLPASGPVASSSYIDTSVAAPLHGLSPSTLRLCSRMERSAKAVSLPARTLLRGARAGLPSGQEVAERLLQERIIKADDFLASSELTRNTCDHSGSVLRTVGLEQNTPLFYYLLKEAEISGLGRTLGPIGSYIVGEVIQRALEADPEGYMSLAGPDWKLPLWRFPNGLDEQVRSVIGIIRLVGDNQLLPECEAKWRSLLPG